MNKIINIEKANYLNEYKIHFEFNDGVETTVDFKNFIFSSAHPDIKNIKTKNYFKNLILIMAKLSGMIMNLHFLFMTYMKGKFNRFDNKT